MKTLILAALAATTVAGAAHAQGYYGDRNRNAYAAPAAYADADRMYDRALWRIDHGLRDGAFDRHTARDFRRQADQIRQHASFARARGAYDPRDVAARYDSLFAQMNRLQGDQRYAANGWQNSDRSVWDRLLDGEHRDGDNRDWHRDGDNRDPNRDGYPR